MISRCSACGQILPTLKYCAACEHSEPAHNLNDNEERTACSVSDGPTAVKCPCRRYEPAEAT